MNWIIEPKNFQLGNLACKPNMCPVDLGCGINCGLCIIHFYGA